LQAVCDARRTTARHFEQQCSFGQKIPRSRFFKLDGLPGFSAAAATENLTRPFKTVNQRVLLTAGAAGFAAQGAKLFRAIGISIPHFP
jgi:hypothetical protein